MTIGPPRDELEELFDELGELHELRAGVQKKVLAHDIKQAMKAKGISPSEMARRMRTSREAVYRLLDPTRTGVTLDSLQRAARRSVSPSTSASKRRPGAPGRDPTARLAGEGSEPLERTPSASIRRRRSRARQRERRGPLGGLGTADRRSRLDASS